MLFADSPTPDKQALLRLINRRHPAYRENESHWRFCLSSYEARRSWFGKNIHPYYKEGDENYAKRIERAYRFNHTREVVDLVNKYLFRGTVIRNSDDAPKCLTDFWSDATGRGQDIDQFSKKAANRSSIMGRVWVVVDSTRTEAVLSKADEQANGDQVYAYIVLPQDVLDMSFDSRGRLNWIFIREAFRDDENPFTGEATEHNNRYRYRLWTRTGWLLIETAREDAAAAESTTTSSMTSKVRITKETKGEHGLGEVPVTWCDHMEEADEAYTTSGLVADIAYLDRAVANYLSNLDVIIQDQTFSQLAMPAQGLLPGKEGHEALIEAGTKSIFTYDGESGQKPFYLSPDVDQSMLLLDVIKQVINEIYHTVGLSGERTKQDNALGVDNSSGVAKAYDFDRINAMLVNKAYALDKFEQRLARLVCAYHGEKIDAKAEDFIKYPEDFDVRGLADEFDIAANLQVLGMPDVVRREQARGLTKKIFPRASKSLQSEIDDALEEWPVDPVVQAKALAEAAIPNANDDGLSSRPTKSDGETGIKKPSRQGQVTDDGARVSSPKPDED